MIAYIYIVKRSMMITYTYRDDSIHIDSKKTIDDKILRGRNKYRVKVLNLIGSRSTWKEECYDYDK